MTNLLAVCTPEWMKTELDSAATQKGWGFSHSFGFDVPSLDLRNPFWVSQEVLARFFHTLDSAGLPRLRPVAPTAHFLTGFSREVLGREVRTVNVLEATSAVIEWPDLWWKLATGKNALFLAKKRTHEEFIREVRDARLDWATELQYSTDFVAPIAREYRAYVLNREVVSISGYLSGEATVYDGATFDIGEATAVSEFLTNIFKGRRLPRTFVADAVVLANGDIHLLEANPVFCSAWYENNMSAVLDCLQAGFYTPDEDAPYLWVPDGDLIHRYMSAGSIRLPFAPDFTFEGSPVMKGRSALDAEPTPSS